MRVSVAEKWLTKRGVGSKNESPIFYGFGNPAILVATVVAAPVDRRLCVPTFRWVCPDAADYAQRPEVWQGRTMQLPR
jgi:hypothetical protein